MGSVLIAGLAFIAAIIFLAWFVKVYTAFCYKKLVADKYELVNLLMETGEVPHKWRIKWLERTVLAGGRHKAAGIVEHLLVKRYIGKLKGVISFVKGSNVFSDNDKFCYLENLNSIRLSWEKRNGIDELY